MNKQDKSVEAGYSTIQEQIVMGIIVGNTIRISDVKVSIT